MEQTAFHSSSKVLRQMAVLVLVVTTIIKVSTADEEMALVNVTRNLAGDIFTLSGLSCGPTRCMEVAHGTALSSMDSSGGCSCQCAPDKPAFREDQMTCVNQIEEYFMASFGGAKRPIIPYVFLPLKGQIIYPSKEIIFTDVEEAICAVTSAQYLSRSGWVSLRDVIDNDVPFSVYRDEGSTFLQWRGSAALHGSLEGRLVAVHVVCSAGAGAGAGAGVRAGAAAAAFRVAGTARHHTALDVRSIPFHAGETITSEPAPQSTTAGLTILESVAIGVCVLLLIFVYAAGITFYIHYKKRQKRKDKDPELSHTVTTDNTSEINSRMDMDSLRLKQNPLLKLDTLTYNGRAYSNDGGFSDTSEHADENTYSHNPQKQVSAMIHSRRKKQARSRGSRSPSTPERILEISQRSRSVSPDGLEVAPHSDLSIVDCSVENNNTSRNSPELIGEPAIRRKLYFNPVFFETEHLKNPPPAAIDFLIKIREVMDIAKEKMTSKRFIPILPDILEEESYHTIDLGWDIPCARQGRRFSAISLKRENSRRAIHCGGCPGCDNNIRELKSSSLARSNSCKECISDDYKQNIVRRWLDEVPPPPQVVVKPIKSVAKVSGTPRVIEPKAKEEVSQNVSENTGTIVSYRTEPVHASATLHYDVNQEVIVKSEDKPIIIEDVKISIDLSNVNVPKKTGTRRVRKKMPPPPPPPSGEDFEPVSLEVKKKMQAVIQELNKCRRQESPVDDVKLVIPVTASDTQYLTEDNQSPKVHRKKIIQKDQLMYFDSLERDAFRKRRSSDDCSSDTSRRRSITAYNNRSFNEEVERGWLDGKEAGDGCSTKYTESEYDHHRVPVSEVFVNQEEQFYSNAPKMGALTIEVLGTPVEHEKSIKEDFDPDTLDRNSRRNSLTPVTEPVKRVEKILLKSGGSFKYKSLFSTPDGITHTIRIENEDSGPDEAFSRKIGSLRQIFEARKSFKQEERGKTYSERRGSLPYGTTDLTAVRKHYKTPDLIQQIEVGDINRLALPFKLRRGSDVSMQYSRGSSISDRLSEERNQFPSKDEIPPRKFGRRNVRKSKRTDLRKLTKKIDDAGYLSTDSNESKRRAKYLMQSRPNHRIPDSIPVQVEVRPLNETYVSFESDTDDFESLCDGRSESGAESVETDSVFFGNIDDGKLIFSEFEVSDGRDSIVQEQIDSGFVGEAVVVSGDSDSEHKSVISIIAGRDGRGSASSVLCDDEEQCGTPVD